MGILSWIVIGLIAGVIAKFLMPGKDPGGFIITILIGIAGAFVGNWIFSTLGIYIGSGIVAVIISAFVGAVVLLFVINLLKRK